MNKSKSIFDYFIPHANHLVYFNEPVIVKDSSVSIFECWGVASHEGIWFMDEEGKWYRWQASGQNAELVKQAVEDRLFLLSYEKEPEAV